jgi:hypothetical protein
MLFWVLGQIRRTVVCKANEQAVTPPTAPNAEAVNGRDSRARVP